MISQAIKDAIAQGLALLSFSNASSPKALVMLYAIGLQESSMQFRVQADGGPARGLWQCERSGGVHGVMTSPSTSSLAQGLCTARGVPFDEMAVWGALSTDDALAAAWARLILLADPKPLPELDDVDGSWDCYQRNWRPGKPRPDDWPANHAQALSEAGLA